MKSYHRSATIARRRSRSVQDGYSTCSKFVCGVLAALALYSFVRYTANVLSFRSLRSNPATVDGSSYAGWNGRAVSGKRLGRTPEKEKLLEEIEVYKKALEEQQATLNSALGAPSQLGVGGSGGFGDNRPWIPNKQEPPKNPDTPAWRIAQGPDYRDDEQPARPSSQSGESSDLVLPPRDCVHGEPMFGVMPVRRPLSEDERLIRQPVPLIVGGTDGSGTRGVVALLERLKVPMIIEDGGTLDVHGAPYMAKGGWPQVVRPVLAWSRGTDYEAGNAPSDLRETTSSALRELRSRMESVRAVYPREDDVYAELIVFFSLSS